MEENMEFGCSGDCSSCGDTEKEEPKEETTEEAPVEEPKEETPAEASVEEAPAEEPVAEEPVAEESTEEAPAEESKEEEILAEPVAEEPKEEVCSCSEETTKSAEDLVRDLVNLVNVCKEEEKQDVTTKIDPATADELVCKLEELAKKVGEICSC